MFGPVMMVWFGLGSQSKIAFASIYAFIPTMLTAIAGVAVIACGGFGAICGSSLATAATGFVHGFSALLVFLVPFAWPLVALWAALQVARARPPAPLAVDLPPLAAAPASAV